jgi:hypothetical protein
MASSATTPDIATSATTSSTTSSFNTPFCRCFRPATYQGEYPR